MGMLLQVRDLKTHFLLDEGTVKAVDGVSFDIDERGTLGVVGESGCGKSVTAQSILRILPSRARIVGGEILYRRRNGGGPGPVTDLARLDPRGSEITDIRGKEIAMIFQEPMTSLSPVYTVGDQIVETIVQHEKSPKIDARQAAIRLLARVGIAKPEQRVDEYPYQLSGGMRQRAMIAMALSCRPRLLIADEPTTALDVTVQAQILELLRELQQEYGMAVMIITHNLGVIAEMAHHVAVMYLGRIVESARAEELYARPLHPYTRALLKAVPRVGRKNRGRMASIKGNVANPYQVPSGCAFHPRCPELIKGRCETTEPVRIVREGGHEVACLLYGT